MSTFTIELQGPYAITSSQSFLMGFTPAAGTSDADADTLVIGFRLDRTWAPAAVALRQEGARVVGEVFATRDVDAARKQVARMLALDVDARGFARLGERDPAIAALFARHPGFRPVAFASPYEAAVWGVLAQRMPMKMAARIKAKLCEAHGDVLDVRGKRLLLVPPPEALARLDAFPGLSAEKIARLHAVAAAAIEGRLDAERLRALPHEESLADLAEIRGVGKWTAAHILYRGAAIHDALPLEEPRVFRGAAHALGLAKIPTSDELSARAEAWRPFGMWMAILFALDLSRAGKWDEGAGVDRRGGSAKKASVKPRRRAAAKAAGRP